MATRSLHLQRIDEEAPPPVPQEKPHYHGHRDRLRQRFKQVGMDGLFDYEVVELLLFLAIPRGDVKPLAKALLKHFGTLTALLNAEESRLREVKGVGSTTVHIIELFRASGLKLLQRDLMGKCVLASWQQVLDYCSASMAFNTREELRLLFLNRKNQLIADEVQQVGTIDQTPLYPREVLKRALDLGASALILVHNHPSGSSTPSKSDIELTLKVIEATKPVGISVYDHLIIGKGKPTSLKALGLI